EAWACATLSAVASMQGRFDEARAFRDRAKKLFDDLGLLLEQTWAAHFFGWLEMLAGDLPAAEAELLHGCDVSVQVGDTGYFSPPLGILADVVSEQGRHEEALEFAQRAEETGAADDEMTQVLLRVARAKALARLGRLEEAEQVAREAVSRSRPTDDTNER